MDAQQLFQKGSEEEILEFLDKPEAKGPVKEPIKVTLWKTWFPIHFAIQRKMPRAVKKMIELVGVDTAAALVGVENNSLDPWTENQIEITSVGFAVEAQDLEILDLLLTEKSDLNTIAKKDDTYGQRGPGPLSDTIITTTAPAMALNRPKVLKYLFFVHKFDLCRDQSSPRVQDQLQQQHKKYSQMLAVRNLLLFSQTDSASFFYKNNFPTDILKLILYFSDLTLK